MNFNPITGGGGFVGSAAGYIPFAGADGSLTDDAGLAFDATSDQLRVGKSIRLVEMASAPTAAATYGYLWVKNTTPTSLIFTTDAGTDIDLSAGSPNNSLDNAYDQGGAGMGRTITVDSGPVQLNASVQGALGIALATTLGISGISITEDNVVRTAPMVELTRQALATGPMINLVPGAATVAALRVNGGKIDLSIAGDLGEYIFSGEDGYVDLVAAISRFSGSLKLAELAAAPADTAAYGQIWVANGTPNTLWFTNDAGTDAGVVTTAAGLTDNMIVRGDGGVLGVQTSTWQIMDTGMIYCENTASVAIDVRLAGAVGQRGFSIADADTTVRSDGMIGLYRYSTSTGPAIVITPGYDPTDPASAIHCNRSMKLTTEPLYGIIIEPEASTASGAAVNETLTITAPAHTRQSNDEHVDVLFDLGRSVGWLGEDHGITITNQRFVFFEKPTATSYTPGYDPELQPYTTTFTNAATVYIEGAPVAGTRAQITNAYALWVDADDVRFDGQLYIGAAGGYINGTTNLRFAPATGYGVTITQAAGADPATPANALMITGGAHAGVTASAEAVDVLYDLARTVTWNTGALASQRFVYFEAPTIAFDGASVVTDAATVYIEGAPAAGANATITSSWALWIDAGATRMDGPLFMLEGAAASADIAAYGQYWVKSDTPCTPWFTGDTGTDYQLAALNVAQAWTAGQLDTPLVVDFTGATTTIDTNARNQFYGQLSIATTALQIPTNIAAGQWFTIDVQQAAAGGKALTAVASYDWGDAGAPDFTTLAASEYATIVCHVLPDGVTIASSCSLNSSLIGIGTDNHIPRYDGTVKLQDSVLTIADTTGAVSAVGVELTFAPATTFGVTVSQTVAAGATPAEALTITGAAHTTVIASAEAVDVLFDLARTVQWATGAIASQRAVFFEAPTYAFVGASTITNAATVYIDGAPLAGTNATITTPSALWIALANGASDLANNGLVFTDTTNAVRTGSFIKATACALATGAMIDLTPGAATVAAIRTWGGKIDLSIAGDLGEYIWSNADGYITIQASQVNIPGIAALVSATASNSITCLDNVSLYFGSGSDTRILHLNTETPDTLHWGVGAESNAVVICETADALVTFNHALQTDPTFFFHAADATDIAKWTSISHGVIATGAGSLSLNPVMGSGVVITQAAFTTDPGTPASALTITGGAHAGVTASTEAVDVLFDLGRTVTWNTGALASQRFVYFEAPTIAFDGASVVTNAATVYIAGAPVAGANATITSSWALWIDAGATRMDGPLFMLEAVAAAASVSTSYGQFWVKTTGSPPNIPMFTDGDGVDHQLAYV